MAKLWGIVKFGAIAILCYFIFGLAGELSAQAILRLASSSERVGWVLYGLGLLTAVSMPLLVWAQQRRGRRFTPFVRVCLIGFTAFFCWQWTVGGVPDWNPLPLSIGFLVCIAAAYIVLHLTAPTTSVTARRTSASS